MIKIILAITGIALISLFVLSLVGSFFFKRGVVSEVQGLFGQKRTEKTEIVTEKDLEGLPEPVQRWLRQTNIVGRKKIFAVRLKQRGLIRTTEEQPWMSARAEQYFTVDNPGFLWKVRVKVNPFLFLVGRDKYFKGKGNMLIKLLAFINVVNAQGREIDQGTMLRYLGEIVWFPSAALNDYVEWQAIDDRSARAIMTYGGITAQAVFSFNENGDVVGFSCKRYMTRNGRYSLEDYSAKLEAHKEFEGIRVPTKGEVSWKLESGDFTYYKLEITDLEYNQPVAF
ncbi:hypothetical protein QBE54_05870 [Thermatribacter velox]|uniref:Uncharacterized protein n=1 Tax=Thermatribacter velox TaxID=3039681 RepID=A0ABZ2Y7Y2_9BACT